MSYSSACMLKKCERKYWLTKVKKRPPDDDAQIDTEAFQFGKAYHEVLELTHHRRPDDLKSVVLSAGRNHGLIREQIFKVYAMCEKYYTAREQTGLQEVTSELRFQDDDAIGFIDAVLENPSTREWWILDLKTSTRIDSLLESRIHRDLQLNFYASYAHDVALALERPLELFAGVRYSLCVRPFAKVKKTETLREYASRAEVKYQEYVVAREHLDPLIAAQFVHAARVRQAELFRITDIELTSPNYLACNDYFKPCEFWSVCYGHPVSARDKITKTVFPTGNNTSEAAAEDDTPEF